MAIFNKLLLAALLPLAGVVVSGVLLPLSVAADIYWIKVKPTVTGAFTVSVEINTNIPGSVVLSANLALKGQNPKDIFIGTDFVRVPIKTGKGSVTIDGTKGVLPYGSKLPAGDYEVEVAFYPKWSENSNASRVAGINKIIKGKASVRLSASGASSAFVKTKAEGQKWVMLNVSSGQRWDPGFWKNKFGPWTVLDYRGAGNPKILRLYYFKSIDMTLLVNDLKKEIITYRIGLADK